MDLLIKADKEMIIPSLLHPDPGSHRLRHELADGSSAGIKALGGLIGIVTGLFSSRFLMCNGGGLRQRQAYIEEATSAARVGVLKLPVTGDTAGDPLKTPGPAINPLIKIINIALMWVPLL